MHTSKIGFVSVAHPDYLNGLVDQQTKLAINNIADSGYEIVETGSLVTDFREAEKAGRFIASNLVDGVVILLSSWVECPSFMSVYQEIKHLPVFVLAFPMSEYEGKFESTGSYVSYAMLKGTLDRIGSTYQSALKPLDSDDTKKMISDFCCACAANAKLKRSRIGLVGYASMSMYPGTFDHVLLRTMIGPEVEQLDSYTVINIAEASTDDSKNKAIDSIKTQSCISDDVTQPFLKKSAGIYSALEQIVIDRSFDAINVKCQYEFSKEYGMVACVPLSLLAEKGYVASCEGDILNTVSMMILSLLSGDTVTYGDAMNHDGNVVKLSTCGFIPFSMGIKGKQNVRKFMPHPGFTGIQCSFTLRPERVTVLRLIEDRCSYHIVYFTGKGLDTDLRQGYMPALDVEMDGDVNDLVSNYSGQHYAICYGDVSSRIESLAKILGIKAIRV